jgi:hypothetical protein
LDFLISSFFLSLSLFQIYDPSGFMMYKEEKKGEAKISFRAQNSGDYKFCFSNRFSTLTAKTISFSLYSGSSDSVAKKGAFLSFH